VRVLERPRRVDDHAPSAARASAARPLGAEPVSFLVLLDLLSIVSAFSIAYAVAPRLKNLLLSESTIRGWITVLAPEIGGEFRPLAEAGWMMLVMALLVVMSNQMIGGYRPVIAQSRTRLVVGAIVAPLSGLCAIALILFTLRIRSWSRLFVFLFTALSAAELFAYRLALRTYRWRRIASGYYARHVLLVGSARALDWLTEHVATTTTRAEYDIVGYLNVPPAPASVTLPIEVADTVVPCLGEVHQLSNLLVHRPIQEVIAVQGGTSEWLRDLVETCDYFRTTLRIVPEALVFGPLKDLQLLYRSDPLRLPEVVLRPRHLDSTALFIKRLLDIALSVLFLILLLPVLVLIALAIKLTTPRLPIFYRWRVVGYNGQRFTGYKFSTMVEDADRRRGELMPLNQMQGPVFKIRNDPRVTPLGRFLRKYSLNELPQLWSVLRGDMSLVGPRPAFPHELERYELWHKRKLTVRPGITCLWQVRGRNRISGFDDWVRMDLEYIDNWSLWLDVKILIWTAWAVVRGSGW